MPAELQTAARQKTATHHQHTEQPLPQVCVRVRACWPIQTHDWI